MSDAPEKAVLTTAFASFEDASRALSTAYSRLEEQFRRVNRELKRTNIELAKSLLEAEETRRLLDGIFASVPCGILSCDLGGTITVANRAMSALLGRKEGSLVGTLYDETIGGWAGLERVIASHGLAPALNAAREKRLARPDGTGCSVEATATLLVGRDGRPAGVVEIMNDLTEVRRLEETLREARTLAALGEMAAGVAHEIRNPLGGVKGFASLLARDLAAEPDRLALVRHVIDGVDAMNRIVTDFLTFGEPGRPAPRLFDARDLIADALALAQAEALPAQGVRIRRSLGDAAILVHADRDHAMQIVLNIVRNAFEATPAGGTVSLGAQSRAGHVVLHVSDTGAGIPTEIAARLFRPFGSTKRGGSGLGLAVAQRLARRNGGDLEIASGPAGTKATIRLPAPPADLDIRHGDA